MCSFKNAFDLSVAEEGKQNISLNFTLNNELFHVFFERLHVLFRGNLVHFSRFGLTGCNETGTLFSVMLRVEP